jgi:hypothetical protein
VNYSAYEQLVFIFGNIRLLGVERPTSFPGSLLLSSGRDPGCGWSRASQILGVNLIVSVRGVGKECVCSVLKLQLWVMKFTVNLQQEIVKRTLKVTSYDERAF